MITLAREEAFVKWQQLWDAARVEFFKVEALQHYDGETIPQTPSYREWLVGNRQKSLELMRESASDWAKQCANRPEINKVRIHIVAKPYNPYIEWEIEHYKISNIPLGGEKVSLIDEAVIDDGTYKGDFMVFDDTFVADSHYDESGKMYEMDFYDENDDITKFIKSKNFLLQHSTPVA